MLEASVSETPVTVYSDESNTIVEYLLTGIDYGELSGLVKENTGLFRITAGKKVYELTNHLGNVNVVISDQKIAIEGASGEVDYYAAEILSITDYYAFGSPMYGRDQQISVYRYGFNGQEKETEVTGSESHTSAEFWMYDTRIGRRWELDPKPIISLSPYSVLLNSPILNCDLLGDTARVNYSYTDADGNLASKEIFRFDDPSANENFTVSENFLPEEFRGTVRAGVENMQSPVVVSSGSIEQDENADATMASIGVGAGLIAGVGISLDLVKPNKGPDSNAWLCYFSYQVGFTAGGGASIVMGDVDVRDDMENQMNYKMFEGASNVWSAGILGVYQVVTSYGRETLAECTLFGVNCPDDSKIIYEAELWGGGAEVAAFRGGSYAFFMGALKPIQK